MKIDYQQWYNEEYFTGKKSYVDGQGVHRLYHGPALTWEGFNIVADSLAALLPKVNWQGKPATLLDIGCSGGDLAARLGQRGFRTYGVDISEYAIKHCIPEMKDRLVCADITECPLLDTLPGIFDSVIATDLLEHIYEEDLDKTFDWILSKTKKWLFFCVATTTGEEFILKKGEDVPQKWRETAVSGHIHVRRFSWWINFFAHKRLRIDWQKMYVFQLKRELTPGWKDTGGWNMGTTVFLEVTR